MAAPISLVAGGALAIAERLVFQRSVAIDHDLFLVPMRAEGIVGIVEDQIDFGPAIAGRREIVGRGARNHAGRAFAGS